MDIKDIARVLYAPHKAFKNIIQKPSYIGPIIVLIIFVIASVGASYVIAQRQFIEQTMPSSDQLDVWTENSSYWTANSGTTVANNTNVYINGSAYYGKTKIQFTNSNASNVWMQISGIGPVNYTLTGFRNVSLRVQIVAPNVAPQNVILTLLSGNSSFSRDLTSTFANGTTNVWYNLTVPLNTADWTRNGSPSWDSITGLKVEFAWSTSSNVNVIFDGLFFRGGYKNSLEVNGLAILPQLAMSGAFQFIFEWIILTGLIYLILKGLKVNSVWKSLFISVGFALITLVIQYIVLGIVYALAYPTLYVPFEYLAQVPSESPIILQALNSQLAFVSLISSAVQIVCWVWLAALGAFLIRANGNILPSAATALPYQPSETPSIVPQATEELSWGKCIAVSAASLLLTIIILGILSFLGFL